MNHASGDSRILAVLDGSADLDDLGSRLRGRGVRIIVAPRHRDAIDLVAHWTPELALVALGGELAASLVRQLDERRIPIVLVGDWQQLQGACDVSSVKAGLLAPAEPSEIAAAAEILLRMNARNEPPDVVDFGRMRLHLLERLVYIDDDRMELPPIEFAILAQLAASPRKPVTAAELARRVWCHATSVTGDDVRRHVFRLRRLIRDQERTPPFIRNRRGFGYMLDATGS